MLKKSLVFILLAIAFNFAQGTPNTNKTDSLFYTDSLIAEQLALDTKHSYDIYYQNQIENERNQEGIGLNVLGSISGALLTGLGLTVMTGLSNEGATGAIVAMPLLVSGVTILTANISGINESRAHAKRRMTYERAHQLYQSRKTGATEPAETASGSVAYNTLVAEQLALDPSHDYDSYFIEEIEKERSQESIAENVIGTIAGVGVTTLGVIVLASMAGGSDDLDNALNDAACFIIGVPLVAGGLPLTIYNIYAIHRDVGHKHQRIKNEETYEYYKSDKLRRSEAQIFVTPTFNVANAATGLNLLVLF